MHKEVLARLNLRPGTLYIYAPWSKKKIDGEDVSGRWPQGTYEVIGLGQCVPVFQELVAYFALKISLMRIKAEIRS